jgi:molybdopterin synthase sulfur carrier subunit
MQITIKLFATFREGRFVSEVREYAPGTRIGEIIDSLEIPHSEIGMIMLDNRHAEPADLLTENSRLALFPLLGGG